VGIKRLARALCIAGIAAASAVHAQMTLPTAAPQPDGATLFANQRATCHTLNPNDPPRQGPNLAYVYGRKAGSVAGFAYGKGVASVDFVWDEQHLDAWLAHPQAVIPGTVMAYGQANPAIRKQIIDWFKEQH
jgi:cytochrome c